MTGIPGAISKFPRSAPLWGPTYEDLAARAAMGWLKNCDFRVTPDNPWEPLGMG